MKLIDADALIADIRATFEGMEGTMASSGALYAIVALKSAPTLTLDDLRPKGRWIAQDETLTKFMCSVCESKNYGGYEMFCPHCGAYMRGGGNDA